MASASIISELETMMNQMNLKIDELVKVKKSQEALHEFVETVKKSLSDSVSNAFKDNDEKTEKKKKDEKKTEKSKKSKKEKVDGEPKKPLSAYMIFCQENRHSIVAKHPGASAKEIMSIFGVEWKNVDDKTPYEEKAAKMKEEYAKAVEQWKASQSESSSDDKSETDEKVEVEDKVEEKPKKKKSSK